MRQESPKLVSGLSTARDHLEARRTLWNGAGGIIADDVAIGAPLPSELCAVVGGGGGPGRMSIAQGEHQKDQRDNEPPVKHCGAPFRLVAIPAIFRAIIGAGCIVVASIRIQCSGWDSALFPRLQRCRKLLCRLAEFAAVLLVERLARGQ